jgi:drug/metabolite transporter (DMT)-like permease
MNLRMGIACMLGGSAILTLNDAVMKWLAAGHPVGQIIFVRGVFVLLLILLLVHRPGGAGLRQLRLSSWSGPILWGLMAVVGTFLFLNSLRFLPLADATALTFAGPLFVVALAPLLLGESVGWGSRLGVAIGFVGVMLILKPGTASFHWIALLPLVVALVEGLRDMLARHMIGRESSLALVFISTLLVTVSGLATLVVGWVPMDREQVQLLALAACFQCASHVLMVKAFRFGPAAVLSPFRYASVLWAAAIGFVLWGDGLDLWMIIGIGLVVASGLYLLRQGRE